MKRFLPSNLSGQFALVMAVALLMASLVNFVLLLGERQWHALWAIWAAKAAFNAWRLGGAAFLIHHIFMREFDAGLAVQAAQAEP